VIFWPRDLSIAVRQKEAVPDFGPWSIKAGIQHVQPPSAILQNMLTVRLHLDDCPESNGALRVLPGSHQSSRLNVLESETLQQNTDPATCCVKSGGRRHNEGSVAPLIPSSNRSRTPSRHSPRIRRRTIARTAAGYISKNSFHTCNLHLLRSIDTQQRQPPGQSSGGQITKQQSTGSNRIVLFLQHGAVLIERREAICRVEQELRQHVRTHLPLNNCKCITK